MPMAFPLWPFLYLLLPSLGWAGPASTDFLTPTLQLVIPSCAQTCLEFFIAENFPSSTCGPPPNFHCLCTSDSTSGFTLGEGALACFESSCNNVVASGALSVYNVCMTVPDAKSNTHGTLTATISPATTTAATSSQGQVTSNYQSSTSPSHSFTRSSSSTALPNPASSIGAMITSAQSTISYFPPSVLSSTQSTKPPAGGVMPLTTPTTSSISSSASATAAPASSSAPALTKPQIAGIVVAGVGATAIGFGLCCLIFCFRRRKFNRRNSGSSFGGDKVVDSEETTPDMSAIAMRDFGHEHRAGLQVIPRIQRSPTRQLRLETPATSSEDGWGQYQRDMAPEERRLAAGPQLPRSFRDEHSPITPASNRTRNSQLLPDKPSYSLFPPPLRVTPRNSIPNQLRPGSTAPTPAVPALRSPFARAALLHPSSMDTSQAHLQCGNSAEDSNDPFMASLNRSAPNIYPYFQESRPRPPPRSLRRDTPRFRVPSWEHPESAGVVRKPVVRPQPPRTQGEGPPPPQIEQHYMAAIEDFHKRKRSRKKGNAPRPSMHYTSGSETSFENSDDEVDEVPNPRSALSPVAEVKSPVRPPEGRVSYPAIPISASESPTRRPNMDRAPHPVRSDSLLGKRLGQDRAREVADRLQGPSSQRSDNGVRNSAKYKILVSPGLEPIRNSESPSSAKSVAKSPPCSSTPTPWRR